MPSVNIACPSCGFSREVPRNSIPAAVKHATCPRCKHSFPIPPASYGPATTPVVPEIRLVMPKAGLTDQTMQQGGQRARQLLVFFLLLVVVLAGLRIWAEGKKRNLPYPNLIAVTERGAAVTWGDEVLLYDWDGVQVGHQPLPEGAVPTQLCYVGDELWLGDHNGNAIRRLHNGSWQTVVDGGTRFQAAFKFVVDTERDEIFVTDSANHAFHHFRTDGTYLRSFGREGKNPGELKFPNSVLFDRDGNLIVANTNCSRIDLFARDGRFLKTIAQVGADGPYRFPSLLARAGDRFVFLHTVDLRRAVVMVYGDQGTAVGKLPLPFPLQHAGDVAAFGTTGLVTDIGQRALHRFDAATLEYTGPFSEALVQRAVETKRLEEHYTAISNYSLNALWVCCLPIFYLYYQTRQREQKRLDKADTRGLVPVESLLVTETDRSKQGLAAALFFVSALLSLYARPHLGTHDFVMQLVMFLNALLGLVIIRLFMESGMANVSRREQVLRLVRAAAPALARLLAPDEKVLLTTAVRRYRYLNHPTLLLLTSQRIVLIDFANRRPTVFWQLGYGDIFTIKSEQVKTGPGFLDRLLKLDQYRITLSLKPGAGKQEVLLHGFGNTVIGQLANAMSGRLSAPRLGYQKLCTTCYTPLDAKSCPNCRSARKTDWKPLLLSLLYPGLGQFYNRDMFKGGAFCLFFTSYVVGVTMPLTQIIDRTAETTPEASSQLIRSLSTMLFIYLSASADADLVGRQGRRPFSRGFFRKGK